MEFTLQIKFHITNFLILSNSFLFAAKLFWISLGKVFKGMNTGTEKKRETIQVPFVTLSREHLEPQPPRYIPQFPLMNLAFDVHIDVQQYMKCIMDNII